MLTRAESPILDTATETTGVHHRLLHADRTFKAVVADKADHRECGPGATSRRTRPADGRERERAAERGDITELKDLRAPDPSASPARRRGHAQV